MAHIAYIIKRRRVWALGRARAWAYLRQGATKPYAWYGSGGCNDALTLPKQKASKVMKEIESKDKLEYAIAYEYRLSPKTIG